MRSKPDNNIEILAETAHINTDKLDELAHLLENEKHVNWNLERKLDDQVLITKKTELAFSTQEKLVNAKNEIIENLRLISQQQKESYRREIIDLTSDSGAAIVEVNNDGQNSVPGFKETIFTLNSIALHGIILNGFLVWADMQRRTNAENVWKAEALKCFTKNEITDAKDMLWEAADNNVLGKLVKRQGISKSKSEIDDISIALANLAEAESLPIFIGTSNMIMQTPSCNSEWENSRLLSDRMKNLEDSLETLVAKQIELLTKNHDKVLSKTDAGNKKIEEVFNRLDIIENKCSDKIDKHTESNFNKDTFSVFGNGGNHDNDDIQITDGRFDSGAFLPRAVRANDITTIQSGSQRISSTVSSTVPSNAITGTAKVKNWRNNLNLLTGTALAVDGMSTMSSDIDMVAYGVAKNVTALQFQNSCKTEGWIYWTVCSSQNTMVQDLYLSRLQLEQLILKNPKMWKFGRMEWD